MKAEPSGACALAAVLSGTVDLGAGDESKAPTDDGDVVIVLSGRNVDDDAFATWVSEVGYKCPVAPQQSKL